MVLVHDVDAVADAFGAGDLDRLPDVEALAFRADHAVAELAGVERDADVGVEGVEEADHTHLPGVLGHGHAPVFRLDEVDADDEGAGWRVLVAAGRCDGAGQFAFGELEAEQRLDEDVCGGKGAQDLEEEVDLDGAAGCGGGFEAAVTVAASAKHRGELGLVGGEGPGEDGACEQGLAGGGELLIVCAGGGLAEGAGGDGGVGPGDELGGREDAAEIGGVHDLEVLLVLGLGAVADFAEPLAAVASALRCGWGRSGQRWRRSGRGR